MNIPTSRTGAAHAAPRTIIGVYHWNLDMGDYINIRTSYNQLYLDQVCALSGWFMGYKMSTLTNSSDMNINAIDPNEAGNLGLMNQYKIRHQHLSGSLHFILKNHVSRTSYNSFQP